MALPPQNTAHPQLTPSLQEVTPWLCPPPGIPRSSAPLPVGSPPPRSLPAPPTYGCIVVEADVGAFPVAGPVHQLTLVRVSRGSFAGQGNHGDQAGGGGDDPNHGAAPTDTTPPLRSLPRPPKGYP